jgi:hypothetical protein
LNKGERKKLFVLSRGHELGNKGLWLMSFLEEAQQGAFLVGVNYPNYIFIF